MDITFLEKSAKLYNTDIIDGWEKLYKKKIFYLYNTLKTFFSGNSALELGCGDGEMTKIISKDFKNLTVVDGSLKFIDEAKAKLNRPNIDFQHSTFENFSTDKTFDIIFMCHILEHLSDPTYILKKAKKWLKKSGKILIAVPNAKSLHRAVGVKMGLLDSEYSLNSQDKKLGHLRVYDINTLSNDITSAGLKVAHWGGGMLKPLSNRQIESQWSDELIDAYFEMGKSFPEICSELY
ncbi:MAG: Ubiquinone biosynthesis O-methyltransferase, partial [Candidatus Anoxychlamydiales bacterium]|nr:Ubiquinone biosynthesis O-methyltransferase [Candidatus Anoxychlamydiales bacterium]